uniref:superoxide dismutase n=1 Tax=Populus davidiana TaxID=266767 RepID=A0A6M2EHS1_9ROSI
MLEALFNSFKNQTVSLLFYLAKKRKLGSFLDCICVKHVCMYTGATHVTGRIAGLSPGLHGFHIHALGDTTNGCNSTGPHFNPLKKDHGAPCDNVRHAGDLGNIIAGSNGVAEVSIKDFQIPLSGMHSILGRAVVVHADPDDLGKGKGF